MGVDALACYGADRESAKREVKERLKYLLIWKENMNIKIAQILELMLNLIDNLAEGEIDYEDKREIEGQIRDLKDGDYE